MLSDVRNVYFSGINGIGMSGLAKILVKEGYNVAGSDLERKAITLHAVVRMNQLSRG